MDPTQTSSPTKAQSNVASAQNPTTSANNESGRNVASSAMAGFGPMTSFDTGAGPTSFASAAERGVASTVPVSFSSAPQQSMNTGPAMGVIDSDDSDLSDVDMDEDDDGAATTPAAASTPNRNIKHKPVTPRYTVFKWADNERYRDVGSAPFKLGEEKPGLLTIRLRAQDGKYYDYVFQGHLDPKPDPEWSNQRWIDRANQWFSQVLYRTVNKGNPEDGTKRPTRKAWTIRELNMIRRVARRHRKQLGHKLRKSDWNTVAAIYNGGLGGTMIRVGERLLTDDTVPKRRAVKKFATEDYEMPVRNAGGIISLIKHWDTDLHQNGPGTDETDGSVVEDQNTEETAGGEDHGLGEPAISGDGDAVMDGMDA